jgi:hypothetical protein
MCIEVHADTCIMGAMPTQLSLEPGFPGKG